ncbi:uncharacterized protein LOC128219458 [Mya arenaria]|uniref:uncharacterized protein LOC128219458 n=1 Tax=Mya arenaria TaxID=6604 RepID=UPI0022E60AE4|nr:uncharacterized protein LOC128219458 [Mya arenaria]
MRFRVCDVNVPVKSPRGKETCRETCVEADQYPCGDTDDTNIFSVYTVENVPPSSNSQDIERNCLLFYYNYRPGHDYYWESCIFYSPTVVLCSNRYFSGLRSTEANSRLENKVTAEIYKGRSRWNRAVEYCIDKGIFPASIQSIKNGNFTDQDAQDHWTGIIKTESIISLNDMLGNSTYPPWTYAYVEKMNQTVYVRFEGDSKRKRKSLCAGDDTSAGPPTTPRETQPTYSKSTTTLAKTITEPLSSTTYGNTAYTHPTRVSTLNTTPISHPVPEGTPASLDRDKGGSSTAIVVGVVIAVTLVIAAVLVVLIKRRYMARACFNNASTANTPGQPSTGVSTAVDKHQRVEYVNTANNEGHRNTAEGNTYEKLNMTKGVDNYISLQEINAVEHDYQNT